MSEQEFDFLVIGAGPGGYVSAIRAAQLGLKAAIVEKEHYGGICLNWGCIPTKALLRSAEVLELVRHSERYGVKQTTAVADLPAMVKRSRDVAKQLNTGVQHLLKKNKVTTFNGHGKLVGKQLVEVTSEKGISKIRAKNIVVATGARARILPGMEPDGSRIMSYREAMIGEQIPDHLVVVGTGAIGVEFASFYRSLGAAVTLVEMVDRILPAEDAEIAQMAAKSFTKAGMKIMTGAKVSSVEKVDQGLKVTVQTADGPKILDASHLLSAVGVVANIEDIGLETLGVKLERGCIQANAHGQTNLSWLYAIGDVTAGPWLAHKASHEGVMVAEHAAGLHPHSLDKARIPGCTYAHPQVASIGLSEQKAKEEGYEVRVGRFPFMGNGKALALGEAEGLVKTVFDAKTGELLGAHMIGAEVTELIQGFAVAIGLETTEEDLMNIIFPHPTLSEMMHESVLSAYGRAIHI